ncbi:MAG: SDR family oxidoreductase [Myxococcota bacterium]|jgi:short-subunit dehydrogenase|nr:SDR family oxidoreductase [Myxococcota bacterium]
MSKVILITGASAGFGKACAEHLAEQGHRVYGTSRRAQFPQEAIDYSQPLLIPMDVCSQESVEKAVHFILEREKRIDVVVNNAGMGVAGAVEETSVEEARALFETNFFGVLRVCRTVLPTFRAQEFGLMINISSLGGLVTLPFQGLYSASKYALESISDALRMEVQPYGIKVVVVEPGDFRTNFSESRVVSAESNDNSLYKQRCDRAIAVMAKDESEGYDPRLLAELLGQIIKTKSPQHRYSIGPLSQRVAIGLRWLMPSWLRDRVLMLLYRV